MSWSFHGVGTPDALKRAIDEEVAGYTAGSASRTEFEAAAPHLKGLLDQVSEDQGMTLEAAGHAFFSGGGKMQGSISVQMKTIGALRT